MITTNHRRDAVLFFAKFLDFITYNALEFVINVLPALKISKTLWNNFLEALYGKPFGKSIT